MYSEPMIALFIENN